MSNSSEPIVVEETYQASASRVWEALTVRDVMVQWYFDSIVEFEPTVGFESRFLVSTGEREFPHVWMVTEVQENERLTYDWTYENYPGSFSSTFDLTETEGGTHLRLTATVTEPFPTGVPEFERESGVGGWTYFLQDSLKAFLEK